MMSGGTVQKRWINAYYKPNSENFIQQSFLLSFGSLLSLIVSEL